MQNDSKPGAPVPAHELARWIREIADFPRPGVNFRDITPLLADAAGFAACMEALAAPWRARDIDVVCGIESRGFVFGAALAQMLGAGFVPLRKGGKLPAQTIGVDYELEYGMDRLEAHADAVSPGARALVVDDVLATGGTLEAARRLVEHLGADIAGGSVVIELEGLAGRARWRDTAPLLSLLRY